MRKFIQIIFIVFVGLASSQPAQSQSVDEGRLKFPMHGDFDPPQSHWLEKDELSVPAPSIRPLNTRSTGDAGELDKSGELRSPPMAPYEFTDRNMTDPDTSQELRSAWELWHRRVEEVVYVRFDGIAQRAFSMSRPICCEVAYTVRHDKTITNIRLLKKSDNIVFNSMLMMVLKSMNGNPVLEFPPGSKREFMEKTGVFTKICNICDPPRQASPEHIDEGLKTK